MGKDTKFFRADFALLAPRVARLRRRRLGACTCFLVSVCPQYLGACAADLRISKVDGWRRSLRWRAPLLAAFVVSSVDFLSRLSLASESCRGSL